ncbi:MAG: tRNA (N6-isopentenyl adenosine(37)-C2)-methylthiotransferase MiaB [Nitrospirales bacterium]|nr:tRNA (N6-isopentenyl adenosine(37)-C2)-methylthiotransferase MiaB [Nitrospirales bacterium]
MKKEPRKYCIVTFGCQMNVHDSEKMAGILQAEGYLEAEGTQDADLIIFNTCSIREKAEQKFFSDLGRLKPLKRKKKNLRIAVAGCIAQQEGEGVRKRMPYVDFVIGPQNIPLLTEILEGKNRIAVEENPLLQVAEPPVERKDSIRAWVNIMYGCNNFCSYCVVPYTRGRERSRPAESILAEVRGLAEQGYKEITLLGQNVNSYTSSLDFPGLLKEINGIHGVQRIRFVTSHPKDLSENLIFAMRDLEKVCEHIHLPLQSGSSRVLQLMNRKYTYEDYRRKVERLRKEIPGIAITSDIIAGFPQETDEDHSQTIAALKEVGFDGIFAFKYSPRPKTKAALMEGDLSEEVKSARLAEILEVQDAMTDRNNAPREGTLQEVFIEGAREDGSPGFQGRTRTNKIVTLPPSEAYKPGDIVTIRIDKANRHTLEAAITV